MYIPVCVCVCKNIGICSPPFPLIFPRKSVLNVCQFNFFFFWKLFIYLFLFVKKIPTFFPPFLQCISIGVNETWIFTIHGLAWPLCTTNSMGRLYPVSLRQPRSSMVDSSALLGQFKNLNRHPRQSRPVTFAHPVP